jgi:hypothetical protein
MGVLGNTAVASIRSGLCLSSLEVDKAGGLDVSYRWLFAPMAVRTILRPAQMLRLLKPLEQRVHSTTGLVLGY